MKCFRTETAVGGRYIVAQPSRMKRIITLFRPKREPHITPHLARDMGLDATTHARLTHRWPSQGPVHPRW
ncbi:hypothetical protein SAMN05444149_103134 [Pseudosulfitobacter pseudonitzschiae]|uniref:Transposase n=1 Tax=Pseudosulfitobacter pseudonitzschiae TaxID=1402135 RepID=A0A073IXL7_9RHOB|nr:hypothetical protein [Pseudosulfitobacter pseudonitzschiae]KEJ95073.1 hypothetical protein SUH3_23510 [Pseudosulfitobacter pseudonitzschiae]QKS07596.1 hypothetical protein HT745_03415 [Pseudosulfitobacter pseudonitzschiae]SHF18993.1 hypothetical protein SAMN05444149_103134 [Pseudosulfitobacter pseudonitzschiae]